MFLLKAYVTVHKFDIICLSERYNDSSNQPDDDKMELAGYDIARADHPTNTKWRGSVEMPTVKGRHDIVFLSEFVTFWLRIADKTCDFLVL